MSADVNIEARLRDAGLPYRSCAEFLDDKLAITAERIALVRDFEMRMERTTWPAADPAAEALIDGRVRATAPEVIPITRLRTNLHLTESEERIVWTLLAHELAPRTRTRRSRELRSGNDSLDPTSDVLRRVVYSADTDSRRAWIELAETAALRRLGLIERTDTSTATPVYRQTWKVSDRVLALAHGEVSLDPTLAAIAHARALVSSSCKLALSEGAAAQVAHACTDRNIVVVHGRAGTGRRSVLEATLGARGKSALVIDGRAISKDRDEATRQLRAVSRECALLGMVPLFRDLDALGANGDISDRIDLIESEIDQLVCATSSRTVARRWRRVVALIELGPPTSDQRAQLWQQALPTIDGSHADDLATMYPIAPALIHTAGVLIASTASGSPSTAEISTALRSILDDRLSGLATRITVTQTWDDLVLPDDQLGAIVELMSRIRERRVVFERWGFAAKVGKGLGMSALFSGPPGTGKTMAAGLIARDLGVELYQVDISKIVSKWIGETEKNLAALFDAAEAGHAVLLFDEADALFGKRTEVRSSNDRYANQEVNFLLQRLESFAGIVLLTTNHETAIDEAFRRRLSMHVQFPMPDVDERVKLWEAMIPAAAPRAKNLGFDRLADEFVMSGGYIRNAVLRAAFLAAAEEAPISANHMMRAAQLEYEAMGKIATRT